MPELTASPATFTPLPARLQAPSPTAPGVPTVGPPPQKHSYKTIGIILMVTVSVLGIGLIMGYRAIGLTSAPPPTTPVFLYPTYTQVAAQDTPTPMPTVVVEDISTLLRSFSFTPHGASSLAQLRRPAIATPTALLKSKNHPFAVRLIPQSPDWLPLPTATISGESGGLYLITDPDIDPIALTSQSTPQVAGVKSITEISRGDIFSPQQIASAAGGLVSDGTAVYVYTAHQTDPLSMYLIDLISRKKYVLPIEGMVSAGIADGFIYMLTTRSSEEISDRCQAQTLIVDPDLQLYRVLDLDWYTDPDTSCEAAVTRVGKTTTILLPYHQDDVGSDTGAYWAIDPTTATISYKLVSRGLTGELEYISALTAPVSDADPHIAFTRQKQRLISELSPRYTLVYKPEEERPFTLYQDEVNTLDPTKYWQFGLGLRITSDTRGNIIFTDKDTSSLHVLTTKGEVRSVLESPVPVYLW